MTESGKKQHNTKRKNVQSQIAFVYERPTTILCQIGGQVSSEKATPKLLRREMQQSEPTAKTAEAPVNVPQPDTSQTKRDSQEEDVKKLQETEVKLNETLERLLAVTDLSSKDGIPMPVVKNGRFSL